LPCAVAFSPVGLKTFGPRVLHSSHFYLVHPNRDLIRLVAPTFRACPEHGEGSADAPTGLGATPKLGHYLTF